LPIGLTAVLLAINLRIDIFVLGRYGSSLALGQFHAAAWFVMATFLAASLLMTVLFPKLSRILADSGVRSGDYLSSLVKHALLFTAAGSLILWFCAPTLLRLFFGADFAPAAHTFRVLAPALPLVFLNTIFFYVFAASRRRFVCLGVLAFGIAAGTLLSIFLTSRYGTTGTATAHVAREFVTGNAYLLFLIQGNHARVAGLALIRVFLGAAVCMAAAVFVAAPFHIEMMWIGAWMVFVFVGALGMLGFPSAGEWRILTDDAP
jgi:O-antigen/teichoic acid export membrane protein